MDIPDDGDIVFVPARPLVSGRAKQVEFEARPLPDDRRLGIAFTSLETLTAALGEHQPWVALPVKDLREILGDRDVTLIMFDPPIPEDAWRWTKEQLNTFARVQ